MSASDSAIQIEARGDTKAALDLAELGRRANDVRRAGDAVRNVVLHANARQWRRSPWKPLAEATQERKRREGLPSQPLRATGKLERSLTSRTGPRQLKKYEPDAIRVGTYLFYAKFADRGTVFQPARDLIDLSFTDRKQIDQILARFIVDGRA